MYKLIFALLFMLSFGFLFWVTETVAEEPATVRVQVDGVWYACELAPSPTPHAVFQTATAWRPPPTPTQEVLPQTQRYRVRCDGGFCGGMNLRAWPGISAPVVGGIAARQVVTIVDEQTDDNYTWGQLDTGAWVAMETISGFAYLLRVNE